MAKQTPPVDDVLDRHDNDTSSACSTPPARRDSSSSLPGMDGTGSPDHAGPAAGPAARVHAGNARSVRLVPENNARGKGKEEKVFPSGKATMEFLGLSRNWYYNLVRLGKPFNG